MLAIKPPMPPLTAATKTVNNKIASGNTKMIAPTKNVPTAFAAAAAPKQQAAQQALCLVNKKKPSIAKPGAK
ncbi:MAG: hypothetical protein NWF04_01220 [Candidatus Bathyarchaeota archaeon]|nr:hypothetical protein [Candidatus Bathyarchaeota archaeon]